MRRGIKKYRPALLLEVLIAFSLIALCLFPLIKPQLAMIQLEKQYLEKMQRDQLARSFFLALKQELYENRGPDLAQLAKPFQGRLPSKKTLVAKNRPPVVYSCEYTLSQKKPLKKEPKKKSIQKYHLLEVELKLLCSKHTQHLEPYHFAILVEGPLDA